MNGSSDQRTGGDFLSTEDVAARLAVSPLTVRRWLREGKLAGYRMDPPIGYRITEADYQKFLAARRREAAIGKTRD